MASPVGQAQADPESAHGHRKSSPAPSSPLDTQCLGRQSPTNSVFAHDDGEIITAPYFPSANTLDDWSRTHAVADPTFSNKFDVKFFRRVNADIHHERFDKLLALIKIARRARQRVNLMDDPVLSVVISAKKTQLAVKLIGRVEKDKLWEVNVYGDTPLHIAAVEGDTIVAQELLWKDKELMAAVNKKEETALHKAAMCGHEITFWCLVYWSGMENVVSYRKGDGSNVLHCAIMGNAPKLALHIAKNYPNLILSRDEAAVTPLQLMVTNPNFFRSHYVGGRLKSFLYKLIPLEEEEEEDDFKIEDEEAGSSINVDTDRDEKSYGWTWKYVRSKILSSWFVRGVFGNLKQFFPILNILENEQNRHVAALELVKYLADAGYDFYCKGYLRVPQQTLFHANWGPSNLEYASTEMPDQLPNRWTEVPVQLPNRWTNRWTEVPVQLPNRWTNRWTEVPVQLPNRWTEVPIQLPNRWTEPPVQLPNRWMEPPLITAAKLGLHDSVRGILEVCPQSAIYLDSNGRNVMQVAIQAGHKKVVSIISEMLQGSNPILPSRLRSMLDNESTRNTILHLAAENSPAEEGDALQLHREILWFEMVEKIVPKELVNSRNTAEQTAHELFTERHKRTLENCKKQLVEMGKMCSGLVAAAVFTSSFSIPSEKNNESGKLAFTIFSHAYVFGFGCAATALVLFLSLVMTPYKERYFRRVIPMQFFFACLSFGLALVAFFVSFACNFVLQIYGEQKLQTNHLALRFLELLLFPVICIIMLLYYGAKFVPSFIRFWK